MFVVRFGTYVVCFAYSVLVHSGGVHGGHYYAFIRPTLGDQWYVCVCVFFFFSFFSGAHSSHMPQLLILHPWCKPILINDA
jgi:hypothetical protein